MQQQIIIMNSGSETSQLPTTRPAPQLVFDDGSRAITENATAVSAAEHDVTSSKHRRGDRGTLSIRDYYEIDRLVEQVQALIKTTAAEYNDNNDDNDDTKRQTQRDGWKFRIALQFPDESLRDAPQVCWELEQALLGEEKEEEEDAVLVFCLGDTTYAPCCPDKVAAAHLQADCILHFGHACLSATTTTTCRDIPVLYSFGRQEMMVEECVLAVSEQIQQDKVKRILLLYEVQYAHAMSELQQRLVQQEDLLLGVEVGQIPAAAAAAAAAANVGRSSSCEPAADIAEQNSNHEVTKQDSIPKLTPEAFVVGGLELPNTMDFSASDSVALLFIGSDTSRQYLNIMLRFLSNSGIQHFWNWNPNDNLLSTTPSPSFQRKLNRRFYLVQKAKQCAVFGILVANLSDTHMRTVVQALRQLLEDHGRDSYVFVVGKINPAKLANFAEIECFILVACPEHSLLEDDREFSTPILTPLEVSMALGVTGWGSVPYSLDRLDFLDHAAVSSAATTRPSQSNLQDDDDVDSDDAPYFSLVTGRFESAPIRQREEKETDLSALPGKGQLTAYHSAAADFLKQREYKGLEVQAGSTQAQSAVKGHEGIASNYGEK